MTAKDLMGMNALIAESISIKKEIRRLERAKNGEVTDSVKGSCCEFPYIEHSVIIKGVGTNKRLRGKIERLQKKLEDIADNCIDCRYDIEEYLEGVTDHVMRDMLRYRFIHKMGWVDIAQYLGGKNTADGVRMAVTRFIAKN